MATANPRNKQNIQLRNEIPREINDIRLRAMTQHTRVKEINYLKSRFGGC